LPAVATVGAGLFLASAGATGIAAAVVRYQLGVRPGTASCLAEANAAPVATIGTAAALAAADPNPLAFLISDGTADHPDAGLLIGNGWRRR
jgi:hypothetical protein